MTEKDWAGGRVSLNLERSRCAPIRGIYLGREGKGVGGAGGGSSKEGRLHARGEGSDHQSLWASALSVAMSAASSATPAMVGSVVGSAVGSTGDYVGSVLGSTSNGRQRRPQRR